MKAPIINPDLNNEDVLYWDKILKSHGLSMDRASRPQIRIRRHRQREERVVFVGNSNDLEDIAEKTAKLPSGGRHVKPSGHQPD